MLLIGMDFETYYDKEYSLRKMTPVEYILDPRFEVIGCAVSVEGLTTFFGDAAFRDFLKSLEGEKFAALAHNASFDMSILSYRYGIVPDMTIDTLSMARAWYAHLYKSLSLDSLARHLGLGAKGTTVHNVIGMSAAAIRAAGLWDAYADYSKNDIDIAMRLFRRMLKEGFPREELRMIDMVLRCAIQPRLIMDRNVLAEHLHVTQVGKQQLIDRIGVEPEELMSNMKFAELLRGFGVEPPTKISPTTGKTTYAFAKTDKAFMDLEEHPSPEVQALVAARLGTKSTLEETRTEKFLRIASLQWPQSEVQQLLPIPLRYSAAVTHRLGGEWGMNMQNLPRGGRLRDSIVAQPGYKIVVADSSQIEARITATLCGQTDLIDAFARGEDIYSDFASEVFGYPVNKKQHPTERFLGKTSILGLGFGMGFERFKATVQMQSKQQVGTEIALSDEEALRIVHLYRNKYSKIPQTWRILDTFIALMTDKTVERTFGPITIKHERILLPSGLYLHYEGLHHTGGQWLFTHGTQAKHIYGGMLLENCLSATTEVLTLAGWKRIVDVTLADRVWDGEEWVRHRGVTFRGNNKTAPLNGVRMTADHEVLTTDGWVRAAQAKGLHRAAVRLPDGFNGCRDDGAETGVVVPMRLREEGEEAARGPWADQLLRMQAGRDCERREHEARDVAPPRVSCVAQHARPMHSADAFRMEEVWRARHNGMPGVAQLSEVLGGYGPDIQKGPDSGTGGQLAGVLEAELFLGLQDDASAQHARQSDDRHAAGKDAACRSGGVFGGWADDTELQDQCGLAGGATVRHAIAEEPTYDLLNCGPRHRFVVRGDDGPFIVHNCVQALARIITMQAALRIEKRFLAEGFGREELLALQVHDELGFMVRDEHVELASHIIGEEMLRAPAWMPNLPLGYELAYGQSYGDAK